MGNFASYVFVFVGFSQHILRLGLCHNMSLQRETIQKCKKFMKASNTVHRLSTVILGKISKKTSKALSYSTISARDASSSNKLVGAQTRTSS